MTDSPPLAPAEMEASAALRDALTAIEVDGQPVRAAALARAAAESLDRTADPSRPVVPGDTARAWIKERCTLEREALTPDADLYRDFRRWHGSEAAPKRAFIAALKALGYPHCRDPHGKSCRQGLRLKPMEEDKPRA